MVAVARRPRRRKATEIGPGENGILMTPEEFDRADFEDGWRYELINGVLIVSPIPSRKERDPNEELGHRLRLYRDTHPQGKALNKTLFEETVETGRNRRRVDRAIWAGFARPPRLSDPPNIVAEFVSKRKRDRLLDYETKRDEFMAINMAEYWVIDRFQRTLTAFYKSQGKIRKRVIQANQIFRSELLPGFELRPSDLFALSEDWPEDPDDELPL